MPHTSVALTAQYLTVCQCFIIQTVHILQHESADTDSLTHSQWRTFSCTSLITLSASSTVTPPYHWRRQPLDTHVLDSMKRQWGASLTALEKMTASVKGSTTPLSLSTPAQKAARKGLRPCNLVSRRRKGGLPSMRRGLSPAA
jgi:hypothetical protein